MPRHIKGIPTDRLMEIRSKLQSRRNNAGSLCKMDALALLAVTQELDSRHANS